MPMLMNSTDCKRDNRHNSSLDATLAAWHKLHKKRHRDVSWFHEHTNRELAELKLCRGGRHNGTFLVRDHVLSRDDFILSLVHKNECLHYRVQHRGHNMYCLQDGCLHEGLDTLVEAYSKQANNLPIKLKHPVTGQPPPALNVKAGLTSPLHDAIVKGNRTEALQILNHDDQPDINLRDNNGSTPLHLAADGGHLDVAAELLHRGAATWAVDSQSYTPLHRACHHNQAEMVHFLLRTGSANALMFDRHDGNVPLHLAAMLGHEVTVKVFMDLSLPVWPRNIAGKTPYDLAMKYSHHTCAKLIDDYKPPPPSTGRSHWFHDDLQREAATGLLTTRGLTEGLFLVRTKSGDSASFVLTVCFQGNVHNYIIKSFRGCAYCIDNGPLFPSLEHCVDHYFTYRSGLAGLLMEGVPPHNMAHADDKPEPPQAPSIPLPKLSRQSFSRQSSAFTSIQSQLDKCQVFQANSIEFVSELGHGEFGRVMLAKWTTDSGEKIDVAVKEHIEVGSKEFLQEALVMAKLDHINIVRLIGVCQGPPILLVQELLVMGSLLDFLLDYPETISVQEDLYLWALQIAVGMIYLEEAGFVHRDLAARNILLQSKYRVKVGDFGLSRAMGSNSDYYQATTSGKWPIKWYAPESINYGKFSSAGDVWSYGVTLWEMYSFGEMPYDQVNGAEVVEYLERGGRLSRPGESCPLDVYAVMTQCWLLCPEDRPSFGRLHQCLLDLHTSLRQITAVAVRNNYYDDCEFQQSYLGGRLQSG